MQTITKESIYQGLLLNQTTKGNNGFYLNHLSTIYSLMTQALVDTCKPLVSHFVIESPKDSALKVLSEELKRWNNSRPHINEPSPVKYFSCLETRPRNKQRHLHLMVIFQSLNDNQDDLKQLQKRLAKLSCIKKSKLLKRQSNCRPFILNKETGEILTSKDETLLRSGSVLYHKLITELPDAFTRFSYLAKVQTKDLEQIRGFNYSSSRIAKPIQKIQTKDTQKPLEDLSILPESSLKTE